MLITSSLAVAVPHFALLSGLVGGVSDTLQSLVLPPLLYVVDVVNKGKLPGIASPSTPKVRGWGVDTDTLLRGHRRLQSTSCHSASGAPFILLVLRTCGMLAVAPQPAPPH